MSASSVSRPYSQEFDHDQAMETLDEEKSPSARDAHLRAGGAAVIGQIIVPPSGHEIALYNNVAIVYHRTHRHPSYQAMPAER